MSTRKSLFVWICVFWCSGAVLGQLLYVDDPCRTNSGTQGICKLQTDCSELLQDQKRTRVRPTLCGFEGNTPILCCPQSIISNAPSDFGAVNFNARPRPGTQPNSGRPNTGGSRPNVNNNLSNRGKTRVSDEMCKLYSKSVTQNFQALPLLPDPEPISITVPKCVHNSSPLIVGGVEAQVGEFPHMAAIGYDASGRIEFNCGGSLISEYYVLTAAHCTYVRSFGAPVVVRLGDHDIEGTDDGVVAEDYRISNITVHPDYKSPSKYNDIALLRLIKQVKFGNTIRPACLWQTENLSQTNAVATGWGQLAYGNGARPSILQKVSLSVIEQNRCAGLKALAPSTMRRAALARGLIREQLCAGDLENGGVDTCQGDSGGPLQVTNWENRCIFYIVGVTSYGIGCGGIESPGVYTRVSSYIDWIEGIVWK